LFRRLSITNQPGVFESRYPIVTFDNSEDPKKIEGDIFISIDRVKENGEKLGTSETELERVMVHGLLHLLGYKDKKKEDKALMTEKEDFYIKQY
jgi:probable rRNA maturation factor